MSRRFALIVLVAAVFAVVAIGAVVHAFRPGSAVSPRQPPQGSRAKETTTVASTPNLDLWELNVLRSPGSAFRPEVLPANARHVTVPVLAYHLIDDAPTTFFHGRYTRAMTVSVEAFDRQMQALRAHRYRTVSPYDVYRAMAGVAALPAHSVVLTFDDGYADNFTNVFPVLRRHGFTATFFVITDMIGHRGYMTWPELAKMRAAGMFIESHTVTHPSLAKIADAAARTELTKSREVLREKLGVDSRVICYPFGNYNARIIEDARAAGYIMGFTTRGGTLMQPQEVLALPRVGVGRRETPSDFLRSIGTAQGAV
ncbi:MAG: polysaccharide deacetylase family protein [Actinobacteria bacterium]|nr:polysaccharide deacetylase family protein [Actinomycetota bacterium]